jgi:hypothetical protein
MRRNRREVARNCRSFFERRNGSYIYKEGEEMKTNTIFAIILIALGILAFAYQGITYTTNEKVVEIGPLEITADTTRTLPLPPIVGAFALAGGIALLVLGRKKS